MAHVEGDIVINRPIEVVFDFVADERNEPTYNPRMIEAKLISDEPIQPGATFSAVAKSAGRPVAMIVEFTDYDRPRLLSSTTHMAAAKVNGTLTFESVDGGTRMAWSWDIHPQGRVQVAQPDHRPDRTTSGTSDLKPPQTNPGASPVVGASS